METPPCRRHRFQVLHVEELQLLYEESTVIQTCMHLTSEHKLDFSATAED